VAVKNKKPIYTLCPALYIKIKVFNLFKRDLIVYIRYITNTDSITIRNYYLQVLAHLVGLAFEDNKRWDNMAVRENCLCNRNRFTAKRLTYLIPYCLIINNKYLLFLALSYIYT
jgi:hypothetical protein